MMLTSLRKTVSIGLPIIGLSLLACAVYANPLLPMQNLTFSNYSGYAPKTLFSAVNPADWYRGQPALPSDLVSIDGPRTISV